MVVHTRRHGSLIFEATQRCNHACLHCYNVWKDAPSYPDAGDLPTQATLAMLAKALDESGAELLTISGGEPLLRSDLGEIVDFLVARQVRVNLITNGSLVTDEIVARLVPGKISVFEVPLLSADPSIHDRLSGARGAFERATLAIARLKAASQRVVAVFVATRLNLPTWRQTVELAVVLGAEGLMFNRFNPGGEGSRHIEELQASPAELAEALDVADELSEQYDLPVACSVPMPPCLFDTARHRVTFGFCPAGTDDAYYTIDPMGNLRPCNHSPRILGNIRQENFWSIVDGPAARDFAVARPAQCAGCRVEQACQGNCKAAAEACCGSVYALDPFLAAFRVGGQSIA